MSKYFKCKWFYAFISFSLLLFNTTIVLSQSQRTDYVMLSQDILENLKKHQPVDLYISQLSSSSLDDLAHDLDSDHRKYAFWINIYNAFIQIHLTEKPDYYEDRRSFFKSRLMTIAGEKMSFADIEHGILRRSQLEYFLGYMSNPFPGKVEKLLRVDSRDYRIHFALNCGAKSCPAIAIYSAENLNKELDYVGKKFLDFFSTYDSDQNIVTTTALFSWFRGDFNGSSGIRSILKTYDITPSLDVKVTTQPYDWTLYLGNYIELPILN